ncbi:unnamed protein product [Closterium sp. Yama58-4]|nr:unnamed protein product [Closterium sp. Yama58-4]
MPTDDPNPPLPRLPDDILRMIFARIGSHGDTFSLAVTCNRWLEIARPAQTALVVRETRETSSRQLAKAIAQFRNLSRIHLPNCSVDSVGDDLLDRIGASCGATLASFRFGTVRPPAIQGAVSSRHADDAHTSRERVAQEAEEHQELPEAEEAMPAESTAEAALYSEITEAGLDRLFRACPRLEEFGLHCAPNISLRPASFLELARIGGGPLDADSVYKWSIPNDASAPPSLQFPKLQAPNLTALPDSLGELTNLRDLQIGCSALRSLPETLGQLSQLTRLHVTDCGLAQLPDSLCNLPALSFLSITYCMRISRLPANLGQLSSLQSLQLHSVFSLETVPESLGQLPNLEALRLHGCKRLTELPTSVYQLTRLQLLSIKDCPRIVSLPEDIGFLSRLESLEINTCESLIGLPPSFVHLISLQSLEVCFCKSFASIPADFGQLPSLHTLKISSISCLAHLPESMGQLSSLKHLELSHWPLLRALPLALFALKSLQCLAVTSCRHLSSLPVSITQLTSLKLLNLSGSAALTALPEFLCRLSSLEQILLTDCFRLVRLPENLGQLINLRLLDLEGCDSLQNLPDALSSLDRLQVRARPVLRRVMATKADNGLDCNSYSKGGGSDLEDQDNLEISQDTQESQQRTGGDVPTVQGGVELEPEGEKRVGEEAWNGEDEWDGDWEWLQEERAQREWHQRSQRWCVLGLSPLRVAKRMLLVQPGKLCRVPLCTGQTRPAQ